MTLPAATVPPISVAAHHPRSRGRLVAMTTVPLTARALLRGQLAYLKDRGFDVTLVSSPGADLAVASAQEGVDTMAVPMTRNVSPLADVVALWRLYRLLAALRPTVTNVSTPKAGLLGGLAAAMARVPCRVYTLRGLRLETVRGPRWAALWLAEWVACRAAHRVVCVGPSLLRRAVGLRLVRAGRAVVLGTGTSNGVDIGRFAPSTQLVHAAAQLRHRFRIPAGAPVVGFVGRLTRDKGLIELVEAHRVLLPQFPELRLLVVGDVEQDNGLPPPTVTALESLPGIVRTGFLADTAPAYHAMDVLALPTYREGFPNACLEAAAAGRPVVASAATGAVDAVLDGDTGMLVPVGDAAALARSLGMLLSDPALARRMGTAGREWVSRSFAPEVVWDRLVALFEDVLSGGAAVGPDTGARQLRATGASG